MFRLFQPKLPVNQDQTDWADRSFLRLASLLGSERMLDATVVLPTDQFFPDRYDRSEAALHQLFVRVAGFMEVNAEDVDVEIHVQDHDLTRSLVPFQEGRTKGAAGLYQHDPLARAQISIDEARLKDPMSLVAVLAHELGHIILLRPGLVGRDEPDMEQLNDLLTIFLGLGIFTANAAFQFRQFTENRTQGWSVNRLGYLSEEMFGYGLARFAFERGENRPTWTKFVSSNLAGHFKRSQNWLNEFGKPLFRHIG
jgi:hypothetical protein